MKILFYINTINHGGAERVITNLANQLANRGHECVLITSFRTTWEYKVDEKVTRIILNEKYINSSFFKRNLKLIYQLRKVIKEQKPVVAMAFMAEPNFRLLFACLGIKVKKIISVRNTPDKEYPNFVFKILAKTLYRSADGVVFQTNEAKKWFPKKIQNKSEIILNQVDRIFYETHYEGKRKDIVTTGRLVPQKNHKLLIEAFAKVAHISDDNLYIYGEGELKEQLKKLVIDKGLENRVFIPGSITNVENKIKDAKIFVLSSDYEGMPNSLMEAMALGIPCISTDCACGGPRVLLEKVKEISLVAVNDSEQMAKAMEKLLLSEEELEKVGEILRKQAEQFSPEKIIIAWEEFLRKIAVNV